MTQKFDENPGENIPDIQKLSCDHKSHVLAEQHVEWFLKAIKPLLIDHFVHGYKHGLESKP